MVGLGDPSCLSMTKSGLSLCGSGEGVGWIAFDEVEAEIASAFGEGADGAVLVGALVRVLAWFAVGVAGGEEREDAAGERVGGGGGFGAPTEDLAATDAVVGGEAEPGADGLGAGPAGQVQPDLAAHLQDGV